MVKTVKTIAAISAMTLTLTLGATNAHAEEVNDPTCGGRYITDYTEIFDKEPDCSTTSTGSENPEKENNTDEEPTAPKEDKDETSSPDEEPKETKPKDDPKEENNKESAPEADAKSSNAAAISEAAANILPVYSASDKAEGGVIQELLGLAMMDKKGADILEGLTKDEKRNIGIYIDTMETREKVQKISEKKPETVIRGLKKNLDEADWNKLNQAAGGE